MAEGQLAPLISSAFPAPPPFYKAFTPEKIKSLRNELQSSSQTPLTSFDPTDPAASSIPDSTSLPREFIELIPPPLPPDGTYSTFGTLHNISSTASLDSPPPPSQDHLLNLLRRILLKFLRITHILSVDPSPKFYGPAWEQLEALFKELHECINAWRPHQARETLIHMMEEQIRDIKAETETVKNGVKKAKGVIIGIAETSGMADLDGIVNEHQGTDLVKGAPKSSPRLERKKMLWRVIEKDVGVE